MDAEILKILITVAGSGLGVCLGAFLTRRNAELSDRRRAEYEEKSAKKRDARNALLDRLILQRRAFDEYARLIIKWSVQPSGQGAGDSLRQMQRAKTEEDAATEQDAIAVYAQLAIAFGDRQFAEQASFTVHAAREGRDNAAVLPFAEQLIGACHQEMVRGILELEKELGIPEPQSPVKPFLPWSEFAAMKKRVFVRNMGVRAGYDPDKFEEIVARVKAMQDSPKGTEGADTRSRVAVPGEADSMADEEASIEAGEAGDGIPGEPKRRLRS